MKKINCFCLLLIGVGVIYWPWASPAYEVPKIWWWRLTIIGLWVLELRIIKRKTVKQLLFLFGLWILLLLPGILLGVDKTKSILGNYYRADGLWTLIAGMLTSMYLTIWADSTWWKMICKGLLIVAAVQVMVAMMGCWHWLFRGDVGCGGLMGQPVFLAQIVWLAIPAWWYIRKELPRFMDLILWQSFVVGLVVSGSWLGIMGVMLMLGVRVFGERRGMILSLAVMIVMVAFWGFSLNRVGVAMESRERIWHKGWLAFEEKPLFGWGLTNFDYAFENVVWPIKFNDDVVVDKAHNELLEYMVTGGVIGTIPYLVIWAWIVNRLRKVAGEKDKAFLLSLTSIYLFLSMTNVMTGLVQMIFWIIIGMLGTDQTAR